MIAELEMIVEKKTTELNRMADQLDKRNIDVETLKQKLKTLEEKERYIFSMHYFIEYIDFMQLRCTVRGAFQK